MRRKSRHKRLAGQQSARRRARNIREPRLIKVTYDIVTPESAEHGDVAESGWRDEEGSEITLDSYDRAEGLTIADKAVAFLRGEGATESSSSHYHQGIWYTSYGETDYRTGEEETRGYHLYNFSPAEERAIFDLMTTKRRR